MKLLEGASEWAGPSRKNRKAQRIFVEVFRSGGPLSMWRESKLIFPVGLVRPFLTLIRGERSYFVAVETVAVPSSPTKGSRQQKEACCRAVSNENLDGASEEGKDCSRQFALLQFLHPMKQVPVTKGEG
jgi:hypothetical protein